MTTDASPPSFLPPAVPSPPATPASADAPVADPADDPACPDVLEPGFGLRFAQFFEQDGLLAVDAAFRDFVVAENPDLGPALLERLDLARRAAVVDSPAAAPDRRAEAELIFALAAPLEAFVARLFGVDEALQALRDHQLALAPLVQAKWKFVKRQAVLLIPPEDLVDFDAGAAARDLGADFGFSDDGRFDELAFARRLEALDAYRKRRRGDPPPAPEVAARLDLARRYAAWAAGTPAGRHHHHAPGREAVIFRLPQGLVPEALIDDLSQAPLVAAPTLTAIGRDDDRIATGRLDTDRPPFDLTDPGPTLAKAIDEVHYCLYCADKQGDTCSRGIREPATTQSVHPVQFRRSIHDTPLTGCPLDERISEFQWLKARQRPLAALAVILIENPMVAGTGHRICNDCMKACVFQQQTPVDIPAAETRTLHDVLALPWGVEIYGLLTRWNPLNVRQWLPRAGSGHRVLVAGLGPAGYTLAHHLLNAGHEVVAIDALKIEPLPARWLAPDPEPVRDLACLEVPLSTRVPGGFGGVAEYGITVRWDKNALTLIRLLLERRRGFRLAGGTRFGSQFDTAGAFAAGFDHIALCLGAGSPRTLTIPNGLASGVRTASDFLMALQLTGAARPDSLANLQIRLPVAVIGGGLTAVDTATEALAYYAVQVEKFLARHEALVAAGHTPTWLAGSTASADAALDAEVAEEYLAHGRQLRALRRDASARGQPAPIVDCLQAWGGATVYYRRRLIDSPAYRLNHEELQRALGEGVRFVESCEPRAFTVDQRGAVTGLDLIAGDGSTVFAAARSVFIAAGTSPNIVLADEEPAHYGRDPHQRGFAFIDADGRPITVPAGQPKPETIAIFVHRHPDGRLVSALGDLHPSYAGNVVKAMASARQGAIAIDGVLRERRPASLMAASPLRDAFAPTRSNETGGAKDAIRSLLDGLVATVQAVRPLASRVHEIVVHAPLAARRFAPGGFYRLQNYEAITAGGTTAAAPTEAALPAMEAIALTGASVDPLAGTVSLIVLDVGATSRISARLRPGMPVVLMGPVGTPTEIAGSETVLLVGGGLGNAVLFSIGAAFRARGSRVLYLAGYRDAKDSFLPEAIEAAADEVIWCCERATPRLTPRRRSDRSVTGTVIDGLSAWADEGGPTELRNAADYGGQGNAGPGIRPEQVNRLIVIGSDRMMAAVARAHGDWLGARLAPGHRAFASINSPMQCMMKGVCGQCVQRIRDPQSGIERHVFTCGAQDQPLGQIDFTGLTERLQQNNLQEKITVEWLKSGHASFKP